MRHTTRHLFLHILQLHQFEFHGYLDGMRSPSQHSYLKRSTSNLHTDTQNKQNLNSHISNKLLNLFLPISEHMYLLLPVFSCQRRTAVRAPRPRPRPTPTPSASSSLSPTTTPAPSTSAAHLLTSRHQQPPPPPP